MDSPVSEICGSSSPCIAMPLERQRSNSAGFIPRESSINAGPLRDAIAAAELGAAPEVPKLVRNRSNSFGSLPAQNAASGFAASMHSPAGGDITPRAARFETLEWEDMDRPETAQRGENECIRVAARFRPLSETEEKEGSDKLCVQFGQDGKSCSIGVDRAFGVSELDFHYDHMFQPEATQEDVYKTVAAPITEGVMNGFNGAIIAYGQTGSGKTHTMLGPAGAQAFNTESSDVNWGEVGIIPRALQDLLDYAAPSEGQVQLRASYVEIYNEHIIDLLAPTQGGSIARDRERCQAASVREQADNLYLPEVTETPVGSVSQAMAVMRTGNMNRHMAETQMNRHSSRSHAVFIVTVTNSIDKGRQKFGQLYLVDLAGSERVMKTGVRGQRMEEAKQINKSLLALGQVIWALAHKQKHVPYRDSKLTQLLRNCLGGNARTAVMIAASPHQWNANESVSALRFGARASLVQNAARINVAEDPKELKRLLQAAREDLNALRTHCRRLQAEVAAFSVAEALPASNFGRSGVRSAWEQSAERNSGGSSSSSSWPAGPAGNTMATTGVATSKRLLVWGLLPSLLCPINRAVMRDPVTASDGWTYEKSAIEKHFVRAGRKMPLSPVTGQRMCSRHVVPSHVIKHLIQQHLPDLAPPEVRLPAISLLPVWLVMSILDLLDARAVARCECAWSSFQVAADAGKLWSKLAVRDFPEGKSESSYANDDNDQIDARKRYAKLRTAARSASFERMVAPVAPASKGLKLFKH